MCLPLALHAAPQLTCTPRFNEQCSFQLLAIPVHVDRSDYKWVSSPQMESRSFFMLRQGLLFNVLDAILHILYSDLREHEAYWDS